MWPWTKRPHESALWATDAMDPPIEAVEETAPESWTSRQTWRTGVSVS